MEEAGARNVGDGGAHLLARVDDVYAERIHRVTPEHMRDETPLHTCSHTHTHTPYSPVELHTCTAIPCTINIHL